MILIITDSERGFYLESDTFLESPLELELLNLDLGNLTLTENCNAMQWLVQHEVINATMFLQ